jgi:serine/threonine protein kinase/CheY-like chemotaxis protein
LPPSLPEAIGKYTIERFIESGGMGDVYLARDPALDRAVAIKFLREGFDSQEMRERFEREARAAGRLSHPNIVTIYEFGIFDSRPFIAMEFVRGEPLSKLIRRRESIPLVRKLEMMEGLCSGLAHAHKTGMVHRDIKPANLMVDDDGGPLKILDFGIVRMAGSGLTSHGVLVGTINYMSPEQITGRGTIDLRSDVFAVGAVLHEVFTYQRAFPGEMTDVLYKIVHAQPDSAAVLSPGLDPGIVRAIDQCLEKTPERRYQDLGVLRRELARIRQRLELEESETYGHTALTLRQPKDPASHASRPSGAHRTPVSGTPAPSPPSAPPQTPGSDRARRAAEAAANLARAQRAAEEARLELEREAEEQARVEAERLEAERQEQERAERARLARERAQAEQARLERQAAERLRAEQERAEQARIEHAREQARQEQARLEQARLDKARAEEAERARVEGERFEQARLEEERKAREQAEKQRLEAQRKAEAEARRQAEARREQKQRDLAQAQKDVAAGRFAQAVSLLRPWAAESAGDASFAAVLKHAEDGVARLEAERRAQEELNRQIGSASELVVRQDFDGASRVVQAILATHPNHTLAKNLEREIARGVEQRTRAAAVVERARALFDARPGEAMELLERFTPAHGLVDSALADMRERHAARERERLRREKQAQRQQQLAALTAQAGALARNRAVQGGAAALLLLIVLIASWSTIFPPEPIEPFADKDTPGSAATPGGQPAVAESGAGPAIVPPAGSDAAGDARTAPAGGGAPGETPAVAGAAAAKPPIAGAVVPPAMTTPATSPRTTGQPGATGGAPGPTPSGGEQPAGSDRSGGAVAAVPPGGATAKPDPVPDDAAKTDPAPETPRDTARVTVPAGPDRVEIAEAEIHRWVAEYTVAFQRMDEAHVRSMNRGSKFKAGQYKAASVTFSNVEVRALEDGQTAVLKAIVQYRYEFSRGNFPPGPPQAIEWPMRKTPNGWVANP